MAYLPDLGEYNTFKGKLAKAERGKPSDEHSIFGIAGNIKRHVGMK
jgi:hypothetical protein